jgi:cellulose synthase/poly-beta-1,6-N-acetylglucosamine synthase-like glycosyltransferase
MPGLDASDAPIPLGGTSNHFVTEQLLELGAWDPHNVAEDADLGIRLTKAGFRTAIVDSTTFEEANSELNNWIRQRSRWVKGYIQTWLVHMRHPLRLARQLGWRRWMSFQLVVGGTFATFLLNPLYWALTTLWLLTEAGVIRAVFPGLVYYAAAFGLHVGNFVFAYLNVAGSMRRGYFDLVKFALFSPIYWGLMSIAAWKGFLQLFYRPFYWEKTVHGLDEGRGERLFDPVQSPREPGHGAWASAAERTR